MTTEDKPPTGEMVLVPVQPLFTPEQAAEALRKFERLKKEVLVRDDYQTIAGKQYIKKSGFRRIALCFNLSDKIVEQERTDREDGTFTWRIIVEARADNGRISSGVAICDSAERNFAHIEHDVYATAHTRAKNRAISDMVAGGIVSAEEMSNTPPEKPKTKKKAQTSTPAGKKALAEVILKKGQTWDKIFKKFGPEIQTRQEQLGDEWSFDSAAVVLAREKGLVEGLPK